MITVPCSRVGHVFRPVPYTKLDEEWFVTWQKNLMRVADVWMDDYKRYFYSSTFVYFHRRVKLDETELKTLEDRFELKKKLKCRSFQWYLNDVIPELPVPPDDTLYHGEILNRRTDSCWEILPDGFLGISYMCYHHRMIVENIFTLNRRGLLLYKDKCVRFMFPSPALKLERCPSHNLKEFGVWRMDYLDTQWGRLKVTLDNHGDEHTWCIEHLTSAVEPHKSQQMPQTAECDNDNAFQVWSFTYRFDYDVDAET